MSRSRNEKTPSPSRRKLFQKRSTSKNVFSWVSSRKNYRHRHKNMPKDRTILSSTSQKARARTCKEKDEERSAHAPKEPENGCHGVAMVRQRGCTGRTSSCRRTTQIQVKSKSTAGRRFRAEGRRRLLNQTSTKKKAKRRCSCVQANVEGLFKYNINLDLVFMANKDQL